jgi:hypothetical protein
VPPYFFSSTTTAHLTLQRLPHVLIYRAVVEHYTRDANGWRLRDYSPGELLPLRGVEVSLSVVELYAKAFGNR